MVRGERMSSGSLTDDWRDPLASLRGNPNGGWGFGEASGPDIGGDDPEPVEKIVVHWPMTLEDMADAGMTLLPDEIAELERRQAERDMWAQSWHGRWVRFRIVVGDAVGRVRHIVGNLLCRHEHDP